MPSPLANLYMRGRQRFPEAQELLRKIVRLRPYDSAAQMQLGRMLAALGQKDDAIAQLLAARSWTGGSGASSRLGRPLS